MANAEQGPVDVREQALKVSTVLENAFNKPRLDVITMREQIISDATALIIMNHTITSTEEKVLGLHPPPMIVTTMGGNNVRAEVVNVAMVQEQKQTQRLHMATQIRGWPARTDADALLSLYEESKRVITKAKHIVQQLRLFTPR